MKIMENRYVVVLLILCAIWLAGCGEHGTMENELESIAPESIALESAVPESVLLEIGTPEEVEAARLAEEGYMVDISWMEIRKNLETPYADDAAFQYIKNEYGKIEFGGEITIGNPDFYEEYREIFKKLMYNRAPFIERETGQAIFLKDFDGLKFGWEKNYYVYAYTYYFGDMDGDGYPELGIRNNYQFNIEYIFKYIPEEEQFVLWYTMGNGYYVITGPLKMQWQGNGGMHTAFYQLNEDGETVCETFLTTGNYNDEVGPYLVMLPAYADCELETHIPEEIKRQGIYAKEEKQWYFRITEEQFNELRAPYWEADEQAEEMIKKVTYTYEELFED